MASLNNKVAIITGAASGLGKSTAERFLREGAKVVIADLPISPGNKVAEALGPNAMFVACDVSKADSIQNLVDETIKKFGKIDILFNNAGLIQGLIPIEEVEEDFLDKFYAVNLKGPMLATRAVVPHMKKAGQGVILMTGSVAAIRARANLSVYSAVKGGLIAFAKAMALELAPFNIRVNWINPVVARTPGTDPEQIAKQEQLIPLGRICEPEDVAAVAAFLASDEAGMITGVGIQVDGGRTIG